MTGTPLHSLERLHDEAVAGTGLDDFGSEDYSEALQVLHRSYQEEAGLTRAGAERVNTQLRVALESRLLLADGRRQHPATTRASVSRPVFVVGLPRTGTTALHRLLCVDPRHQGLEYWLAEAPQPRPPRQEWPDHPGYQRMERFLAAQHDANPEMKGVHYVAPQIVEECWRAERISFRSFAFQNAAHLPTYGAWLADRDMSPAYRVHRDVLRLVGLHDQDRRWVLKSPSHLFSIDDLLATYPDALIVQTHRHPRTVVASVSSLITRACQGTSTVFTPDVVGQDSLALWAKGARDAMEARSRHGADHFVDVFYDDFVTDAVAVVESIYERLGEPMDAALRDSVRASHDESKVSERRPNHRYRLEDFGLSAGDVDAAFSEYIGRHFN